MIERDVQLLAAIVGEIAVMMRRMGIEDHLEAILQPVHDGVLDLIDQVADIREIVAQTYEAQPLARK